MECYYTIGERTRDVSTAESVQYYADTLQSLQCSLGYPTRESVGTLELNPAEFVAEDLNDRAFGQCDMGGSSCLRREFHIDLLTHDDSFRHAIHPHCLRYQCNKEDRGNNS